MFDIDIDGDSKSMCAQASRSLDVAPIERPSRLEQVLMEALWQQREFIANTLQCVCSAMATMKLNDTVKNARQPLYRNKRSPHRFSRRSVQFLEPSLMSNAARIVPSGWRCIGP